MRSLKRVSEELSLLFDKLTKSKLIHEAVLLVVQGDGQELLAKTYGDRTLDSPIVMASVTKLWTTACVLQLVEEDILALDCKLSKLLEPELLQQLHHFEGQDYSNDLTVAHLLYQTSGLPDAFQEGEPSMKERLLREDFAYTVFEEAELVRQQESHFKPGSGVEAYYADINFDLLGRVIEKVTDQTLAKVFQERIIEPLKLTDSYLLTPEQAVVPPVYYQHTLINRPQFLMSAGASGGGVTSARDLVSFMRAFAGGKIFANKRFKHLSDYRPLQAYFGSINYGAGIMQIGELIGHTGSAGAFAFYYPELDTYLVGDFNQMSKPFLPLLATIQITKILEKN